MSRDRVEAGDPSVTRVALLLGLLVALTVIGSSAVAVALPVVGRDLSLDRAGTAWVLAAFSLTFSVSTAVFGRLADLRGLRRPLRLGVGLFALGSLLAAAAWSFPVLVAGRLIQGMGAGAVPVLGLGIISARFRGQARTRAVGGLTAVVSVVSGSGPLIGGALTQLVSWRAVLGLPVLALLLVAPVTAVAPEQATTPGRLDWSGTVLVTAAVTALTVLLQAPAIGPSPPVLAAVVGAGVLVMILLVVHVRRRPDGLLPRAVITHPGVVLSSLSGLSLMAGYLAALYGVPLLLADRLGWSPLQIGLALVPAALAGAAVSRMVGGVPVHVPREWLAAGLGLGSAAGMVLIAAAGGAPAATVAGMALVIAGFAGGQVALLDALPLRVPAAVRGVALGVFNLIFFIGAAIGSAAAGALAQWADVPTALAVIAVVPVAGALCAAAARRLDRMPQA